MNITAATAITFLRIFLTPFIVYAIVNQYWLTALVLFLLAALTDLLDGYVARIYKQESSFGQKLDPVADKTVLLGSLWALLYGVHDQYILYGMYFLMLKELILLVGAYFLYSNYKIFIKPSGLSRLASLAEFVLVILLLLNNFYGFPLWVLQGFISLFCACSAALLIRYGLYVMRLVRKK